MHVLSIQSWVAYGHVGNRMATFALERLGHKVTCIHTVIFSNHPGHGGFRGEVRPARSIDEQVAGLVERGLLDDLDLVLSGYLGSADNGQAVARAVDRLGAPYLCDPVMGDDPGGLFVAPDLPRVLAAELLPRAAAATPNRFELAHLTGRTVLGPDDAAAAAAGLGPGIVVATGIPDGGGIACIGWSGGEVHRISRRRRPHPGHGAGDLFAALFAARYSEDWRGAVTAAAATVDAVIAESRGRELAVVGAQAAIAAPPS